jgi:hypothetical protein
MELIQEINEVAESAVETAVEKLLWSFASKGMTRKQALSEIIFCANRIRSQEPEETVDRP